MGASERHDLAVRRQAALVSRAATVHRIPPRVRDDREPPLLWDGTAQISELIWVERKRKYFCKRGLTRFLKIRSDLPVGSICRIPMPGFDLSWRQISKQQDANEAEATKPSRSRHSGMVRQHRPQMRNCASGNLEIPGSMLSHRPGMTASTLLLPASARRSRTCAEIRPPAPSAPRGALRCR